DRDWPVHRQRLQRERKGDRAAQRQDRELRGEGRWRRVGHRRATVYQVLGAWCFVLGAYRVLGAWCVLGGWCGAWYGTACASTSPQPRPGTKHQAPGTDSISL